MIDTAAILVKNTKISKSYELIILYSIDQFNKVSIYYTLSREGKIPYRKLELDKNQQFALIELKGEKENYIYLLLNPNYEKNYNHIFNKIKAKKISKFQIVITIGVTTGNTSILYNKSSGGSMYYSAKIIGNVGTKLQLFYKLKKLRLGVFLMQDKYKYYYNTNINSVVYSTGKVNYNYSTRGDWPESTFHYGLSISIDQLLFNKYIISPSLSGGGYIFPTSVLPFDAIDTNSTKKNFKKKVSLGAGMYIKLPIYDNIWFTTGCVYQYNNFNASSYFKDIQSNSYKSRQEIIRFEAGLCFNF